MKFGIGQSVYRTEDERLLTGNGSFVEDLSLPGMLHAFILRSPVAHAKINAINASDALRRKGVRAVLTGQDYVEDGIGGIDCTTLFPGLHKNIAAGTVPALAIDMIRHVGMPVAVVLADTAAVARDAAEHILLDLEELPAIADAKDAVQPNAPQLWPNARNNIAFEIELGDAAATGKAIESADHVTVLKLRNNRVSANSLEMRGTIAEYDSRDRRLTIHTSTQAPHTIKGQIASALGMPQTGIRVVAFDVGGGFGMKGGIYPEDILVAWASKRLRAAVKWQADRSEALMSDYHGRDQIAEATIGIDTEGRITALKIAFDHNAGAFLSPGGGVAPMFAAALATGCYSIPVAHVKARAVYTNTSPTQPYRGAGRPEAALLIERLLDKAARETGRDRIEMRRLNMLKPGEFPYKTPLLYTLDSGNYPAILDRAMELADWTGAADRRQKSSANGKLRGIGVALHMENAGLGNESAEIRFGPDGSVTVLAGTFSQGQGHETVYAQMVSEWLGIAFERIRVVQGDTDAVPFGRGTVASRSMINGGGSLRFAADAVIEKAKSIAGFMLESDAEDIEFEAGTLKVTGTDRTISIQEVAAAAFRPNIPAELGLGLSGEGAFKLEGFTFPNGCQVAEVEIDPETGTATICNLVSVDDVGRVINPMLLEGQLVGGIAQGIGQALMENVVYDTGGQLVTGSFMDYQMPRASEIPPICVETLNVPTSTNPLGVRGAGESGTVGATPAVMSAILDALAGLGIGDLEMPASPGRIWEAINRVEKGG